MARGLDTAPVIALSQEGLVQTGASIYGNFSAHWIARQLASLSALELVAGNNRAAPLRAPNFFITVSLHVHGQPYPFE